MSFFSWFPSHQIHHFASIASALPPFVLDRSSLLTHMLYFPFWTSHCFLSSFEFEMSSSNLTCSNTTITIYISNTDLFRTADKYQINYVTSPLSMKWPFVIDTVKTESLTPPHTFTFPSFYECAKRSSIATSTKLLTLKPQKLLFVHLYFSCLLHPISKSCYLCFFQKKSKISSIFSISTTTHLNPHLQHGPWKLQQLSNLSPCFYSQCLQSILHLAPYNST